MSDPLSVSASIAGLVGLAITLSQVSYQYVASAKGASAAWPPYMQELSALTSVLIRLQDVRDTHERDLVLLGAAATAAAAAARPPELASAEIDRCLGDLRQLKACALRNPEIVVALISHGAAPDQVNENGKTPLHQACQRGSLAVVNALLGISASSIMTEDNWGYTPLRSLLRDGGRGTERQPGENLAICKSLVGYGALIHEVDSDGRTTADMAVEHWDLDLIQWLVDSGVPFSNDGQTALSTIASAPFTARYSCYTPASAIERTLELFLTLCPLVVRQHQVVAWPRGRESPLAAVITNGN